MPNYKPFAPSITVGPEVRKSEPPNGENENQVVCLFHNPNLVAQTKTFSRTVAAMLAYKVPANHRFRALSVIVHFKNTLGLVSIVSDGTIDTSDDVHWQAQCRNGNSAQVYPVNFTIVANEYVSYTTGGTNVFYIAINGIEEDYP